MTGSRANLSARILIVDDESQNRRLLERILAPEGFVIFMAASGEEAMVAVAEQRPDLILLDVMMPTMDGYSVAAQIKGSVDTKNIPIIMISALDGREVKMRALDAGAEDFLTKPVDRAELCVRVRNLLRLKAGCDYYTQYSHVLEGEVTSRMADLVEQTAALEQQAALLDLVHDAIVSCDMDWRVVFWSRGAEVMYGWARSEALGQVMHHLLKPESAAPIEQMEAALLGAGLWEGKMIHHRRDGTRLVVGIRWALLRSGDGAPARILSINTDITKP